MKKYNNIVKYFFVVISFMALLSGCGRKLDNYDIVTSNEPLHSLIESITSGVKISSLLPRGANYHNYTPSTQDIAMINNAKVFVCVGDDEPFVNDIIKNLSSNVKVIKLSDALGYEASGGLIKGDPHFWLSPKTTLNVANVLHSQLINLFNSNPDYESNYQQLINTNLLYEEKIKSLGSKTIIIGHDGLGYLTRDYGLQSVSLYGASEEHAPTAEETKKIVDIINSENLKCIYYLSGSDESQAIKDLAIENNVEAVELNSLLGVESYDMYISGLENNINNIARVKNDSN